MSAFQQETQMIEAVPRRVDCTQMIAANRKEGAVVYFVIKSRYAAPVEGVNRHVQPLVARPRRLHDRDGRALPGSCECRRVARPPAQWPASARGGRLPDR